MPSRRSLFTFSLLTLIFPLLVSAQGYDFGTPPPSLPTSSDLAQQYTSPYKNVPQGGYNPNPAPNQGVYGWDPSPSPSPTDPGIYVAPTNQYASKPLSQYAPYASAPVNPVYGPPPANPTPPSYGPPPSYENGIYPSGPILSSPISSTFSAVPTISNSTISTGGVTTTASAAGAFSSLMGLSATERCDATVIATVTHTCISTVTSVLTEVTTETTTVTVPTVNLVGVVSTPPSFSAVPTTLISTVGVGLNSSVSVNTTTQTNGGVLSTTTPTPSTPTGVVGPSYGSPLSYASPTPWGYGQPPSYGQPSTDDNGGDDDSGYSTSPNDGGEEGDDEDGSGSYGDRWEDEGDGETGPWASGSAPDSEGGSESEEQSGGSSSLDWLLEILK